MQYFTAKNAKCAEEVGVMQHCSFVKMFVVLIFSVVGLSMLLGELKN